jgi:hypothetical protein
MCLPLDFNLKGFKESNKPNYPVYTLPDAIDANASY